LEIEPRVALYRVAKAKNQDIQEDRFEAQGVSYLEDVARRYDTNSLGYARRIPATMHPDEVARACLSFITSVL
jgi:thymidylate kinase